MAFTLLATSDLHLGRRSSGLPDNSPLASATTTWQRIVQLCQDRNIDAVLIAGDVIDEENDFFESIGPLVSGFTTLAEQQIPTYLVSGNHDYNVLSEAVRQVDSEWIMLMGQNGKWQIDTLELNRSILQIAGRSFAGTTQETDPLTDFPSDKIDPDLPSIGLVHGEVEQPESIYGPIDRDRLIDSRLDAWVIGHIHKPRILRKKNPLICYPGSPHAFSASEKDDHGPWIFKIREDRSINTEHVSLSPIRYEDIEIDVSDIESKDEFRDTIRTRLTEFVDQITPSLDQVHHLIFDVWIVGSTGYAQLFEGWGNELNGYSEEVPGTDLIFSVRKVKYNFSPSLDGLEEMIGQDNPAALLAEMLVSLRKGEDHELVDEMMDQWKLEMDRINRSDIFRPLMNHNGQIPPNEGEARNYLEKECEKLLLKLFSQQDQREGA